jgi:hypothetical protein
MIVRFGSSTDEAWSRASMTQRYGCSEDEVAHYTCYRSREPLMVDGRLTEAAWCWNKHGVLDTHLPECFTRMHFSSQYVDEIGHA